MEKRGTLPPALRATVMRRARSMVPAWSASHPLPPSRLVQLGMLVAKRFHGVGIWYAKLKQSKKTPSMNGALASGGISLLTKKSRIDSLATFHIGFTALKPTSREGKKCHNLRRRNNERVGAQQAGGVLLSTRCSTRPRPTPDARPPKPTVQTTSWRALSIFLAHPVSPSLLPRLGHRTHTCVARILAGLSL